MYSMSVSIHHIYSSVTLLFFLWLLPLHRTPSLREHTGKDKVHCRDNTEGAVVPRTERLYFFSLHPRQITL